TRSKRDWSSDVCSSDLVVMNDFVLPSVLSIPAFSPISQHLIGSIVAFVLGLVVTYVLGFEEKNDNYNHQLVGVKPEIISSPLERSEERRVGKECRPRRG